MAILTLPTAIVNQIPPFFRQGPTLIQTTPVWILPASSHLKGLPLLQLPPPPLDAFDPPLHSATSPGLAVLRSTHPATLLALPPCTLLALLTLLPCVC